MTPVEGYAADLRRNKSRKARRRKPGGKTVGLVPRAHLSALLMNWMLYALTSIMYTWEYIDLPLSPLTPPRCRCQFAG
eukprot:1051072-Pyramimonas_sp.AAC.1